MKFNLKNPLWKTEPNYCRAGLEQELRQLENHGRLAGTIVIKEILGDA